MSDMHELPTGITTGWQEKVAALEADKERMISEFVIENGKRHELESALASERAARTAAEKVIARAAMTWRVYQAADRDIVNGRPLDDALDEKSDASATLDALFTPNTRFREGTL